MKIEDLYLELGRAMTEKITVGQESQAKQAVLQEQVHQLNRELQSERDRTKNRQDRIQNHVDELQEAIRLASEGVDPTLAKLTAKESLEDRRAKEKIQSNGQFSYNNPPYSVTLPVTVAAGANAGVNAGAAGQWHTYNIPTYGGTNLSGNGAI